MYYASLTLQLRLVGSSITMQVNSVPTTNLSAFNFNTSTAQTSSFFFSLSPNALTASGTRVSAMFAFYNDARVFLSQTTKNVTLASPVVDVSLNGATLTGTLTFNLVPTNFNASITYTCAFWDTITRSFSTTGMTTTIVQGVVRCTSGHLTNFAVLTVRCAVCVCVKLF